MPCSDVMRVVVAGLLKIYNNLYTLDALLCGHRTTFPDGPMGVRTLWLFDVIVCIMRAARVVMVTVINVGPDVGILQC